MRGKYRSYLKDFLKLKQDVSDTRDYLRPNSISLPACTVDNEILSDLISNIREYEDQYSGLLGDLAVKDDRMKKYFKGLIKVVDK